MITKEEMGAFIDGELWKEISDFLEEEKEVAKEELSTIDFSLPISNVQAVKLQSKIEVVDSVLDRIETMKEEVLEQDG